MKIFSSKLQFFFMWAAGCHPGYGKQVFSMVVLQSKKCAPKIKISYAKCKINIDLEKFEWHYSSNSLKN